MTLIRGKLRCDACLHWSKAISLIADFFSLFKTIFMQWFQIFQNSFRHAGLQMMEIKNNFIYTFSKWMVIILKLAEIHFLPLRTILSIDIEIVWSQFQGPPGRNSNVLFFYRNDLFQSSIKKNRKLYGMVTFCYPHRLQHRTDNQKDLREVQRTFGIEVSSDVSQRQGAL